MKIIINENQFNSILSETAGFPTQGLDTAMDIIDKLLENIYDIEDRICDLQAEYADDEDEEEEDYKQYVVNDWKDEFEYYFDVESGNQRYEIDLFYDSSWKGMTKKAETDGDGNISINYYPIHKIVLDVNEKANAMPNQVNISGTIKNNIYDYLYPIILHELTHDTNKDGGTNDYRWLGSYNRFNEADLRDMLYLFSDNEMNSRIASAAAIAKTHFAMDIDNYESEKEFYQFDMNEISKYIINEVLEDDSQELQLSAMKTLLGLLQRELQDCDTYHASRKEIANNSSPYSLAYDLSRNDSRLKHNRKLKQYFMENYKLGIKYVLSFYTKLYEEFIWKIRRACYGVLTM